MFLELFAWVIYLLKNKTFKLWTGNIVANVVKLLNF